MVFVRKTAKECQDARMGNAAVEKSFTANLVKVERAQATLAIDFHSSSCSVGMISAFPHTAGMSPAYEAPEREPLDRPAPTLICFLPVKHSGLRCANSGGEDCGQNCLDEVMLPQR